MRFNLQMRARRIKGHTEAVVARLVKYRTGEIRVDLAELSRLATIVAGIDLEMKLLVLELANEARERTVALSAAVERTPAPDPDFIGVDFGRELTPSEVETLRTIGLNQVAEEVLQQHPVSSVYAPEPERGFLDDMAAPKKVVPMPTGHARRMLTLLRRSPIHQGGAS